MFNWNRLVVDDFAAGVTDFYLDAAPNRAQKIDNLDITSEINQQNRKLLMRPGRTLYDTAAPQIPVGNQRINELIRHPSDEALVYSSNRIYRKAVGNWTEISGPTGNPALSEGSLSSVLSSDELDQQMLLGNDEYAYPVKVYKDETGTWRVRAASMPSIELEAAIEIANDLKAKFNAHIADATEHPTPDGVNVVTSPSAFDDGSLITLTNELLTKYAAHEGDAELAAGWAFHAGQELSDHSLADESAAVLVSEAAARLLDLRTKYNGHDADTGAHTVAAANQVTMGAIPSVSGAAGAANYLYRLHYEYAYYVGDVKFIDRGATYEIVGAALTTGAKTVSDIPVIDNGTKKNLDLAGIDVVISRTEDGGQTFYEVGRVNSGTTSFVDTVLDADLVLNEELYTNDGSVDQDEAPRSKYLAVVGNTTYYANIKIGNTVYPNRIRQSIPGNFSSPGSFEIQVPGAITGIDWIGDLPIIFMEDRAFRIEGVIDALGEGNAVPVEIPGKQGCISHSGIVRVPGGLIFPSKGGFWFTNGYQMRPVSNGIPNTYGLITDSDMKKKRLHGFYDADRRRILWQAQLYGHSADVDTTLVMLLEDRITEDMPFYSYSGGHQLPENWKVTSMIYLMGEILMSDARGYILKFDPSLTTDLKIEPLKPVSEWVKATIIWDYRSFGFAAGNSGELKTSNEVTIVAKNRGPISIRPGVCNDDSGDYRLMKEIRSASGIPWGTPHKPWGSSGIKWGIAKLIQGVRNIPKFFFRWVYKQVQVTNGYTIIRASDTFGLANLQAAAKTVTLNVAGEEWPDDVVDYDLAFEDDGYVKKYHVAQRVSATQVLLDDPLATLVTAPTTKWQLHGYRKGDKLELVSFSYPWAFAGPRLGQYKDTPTGTGKNA
jgi:hypothetical protein